MDRIEFDSRRRKKKKKKKKDGYSLSEVSANVKKKWQCKMQA